ncbi:ATP-binding protein [Rhodococcus opacus]|uniref:ATP-binding protein n=1 Tax=Rhodococcus opacus TaxID=37919 RepID=UPI0027DF0BD9|nr:ATP-binding protein [Rhodococcus opacus]
MTNDVPESEQSLVDLVLELADADDQLSEEVGLLVLAALEGEDSLSDALDSEAAAANVRVRVESKSTPDPIGAFLDSISVAGFRGIGPTAELALHPAPGLTIVSGRNGSGKSSFSEALEYAVTGTSYRWNKPSKQWRSGWRNIHHASPCEIRIRLAVERDQPTTIGIDWADDADLDAPKSWVQTAGQKRVNGTDSLGWGSAVDLHRPILSYDELGGLLEEGPSVLHDALAKLLGLEQIADAENRLASELKSRKEARTSANALGKTLISLLEASSDDRASMALTSVKKKRVDEASQTATGGGNTESGSLRSLHALADLRVPIPDAVERAVQALRDAVSGAADAAIEAISIATQRSELLDTALTIHRDHGDMKCPVCGEGELDSDWRRRAEADMADDRDRLDDLRRRKAALNAARQDAADVVRGIAQVSEVDGVVLDAFEPYRRAVKLWLDSPDGDLALADHLESKYPAVAESAKALREAATAEVAAREDKWSPIAERIVEWVTAERRAQVEDPIVKRLDKAKKWVTTNATGLRNQRLEPIAVQAREIWLELRHESNVDLGPITLEGANTRRHVNLEAQVDGEPVGALAVMSQGELHALALALFLPRATMPNSPFRFVALDDPIQAMDPAKVDGFVRVMSRIAETRQVIVFSHDDRLASSVRQLGVDARVVEVTRASASVVQVSEALNPAKRYVKDAFALVSDEKLPDEVKGRVAPGLFRMAVEAAARQVYYGRRHMAGDAREVIEAQWLESKTTQQRIALAIHDDRTANVSGWREQRAHRKSTMSICGRGAHQGVGVLTRDHSRELEKTVNDLLDSAK